MNNEVDLEQRPENILHERMNGWALLPTYQHVPPPNPDSPSQSLLKTRLERVAMGFTAKEAHKMGLLTFIILNILIGSSSMLFDTFQRLISFCGIFWHHFR